MPQNRNRKLNWKIALIPIWAVLVALTTFGSLIPASRVQAESEKFFSQRSKWQVDYDYRFHPDAPNVWILVKSVQIDGVRDNGSSRPLAVGDYVNVESILANLLVFDVYGIYFGIVPADADYTGGSCGSTPTDCNFPIGRIDNFTVNPVTDQIITVSTDKFTNRTGTQKYKIIPVINAANKPDVPLDSGIGSYFTVTWDANAPLNSSGTRTERLIPAIGQAQLTPNNSGGAITAILISIINTVLVAVLTVVVGGVEIIYSLLVGPIIRAMLGGTPEFIAANIPPFVEYGWIYVRDVMNLLFILVLIFAGVATMLHIGEYGLKKTITRVIIVALAVNFSLLAGQIVLNFAQIMMNTFINPTDVDLIRQNIDFSRINVWDFQAGDALQGTAMLLFHIIYEIGVVAVLGAIAVFLLIRLTAVWLLLILAPAAYILYLFEPTEEYLSQWWHKFIAYAFFAPIMAFFLAIISKLAQSGYFGNGQVEGAASISNGVTAAMQGAMLIVMLWGTLYFASKMGIAGADTVVHGATSAWKSGFGIGGWSAGKLGGLTARKWNEWTSGLMEQREGAKPPGLMRKAAFAVLNPKAFASGWAARTEELEHHAHEVAVSRGREVAEQLRTGGKLQIPYTQFVERKVENEYMKEYEGMPKEQIIGIAKKMETMKGHEAELRRRSIIKAAALGGYLDDIMTHPSFDMGKYAKSDVTKAQVANGEVYTPELLQEFLQKYLSGDHGLSEQAMRLMGEDMEELGKKNGHLEYGGMYEYNPDTGVWEARTAQEQADYMAYEYSKLGGRDQTKIAPHVLSVLRRVQVKDNDGNVVVDPKTGKPMTKTVWGTGSKKQTALSKAVQGKMGYGVMREAQHLQERLADLVHRDGLNHKTGVLEITEEQWQEIQAYREENPDLAAALVSRAYDRDPRNAIDNGIKIKVSINGSEPREETFKGSGLGAGMKDDKGKGKGESSEKPGGPEEKK